jgi:hypothetical protein
MHIENCGSMVKKDVWFLSFSGIPTSLPPSHVTYVVISEGILDPSDLTWFLFLKKVSVTKQKPKWFLLGYGAPHSNKN